MSTIPQRPGYSLLAYGIAHDMNNILMSLSTNLELMDIPDGDANSPFHNIADRAAKRAAALMRLLDPLTNDANTEMHPEPLQAVVELGLILFRATRPPVNVTVEAISPQVIINTDCGLLLDVLLNILITLAGCCEGRGSIALSTAEDLPENTISADCGILITAPHIPMDWSRQQWTPYFHQQEFPDLQTGIQSQLKRMQGFCKRDIETGSIILGFKQAAE